MVPVIYHFVSIQKTVLMFKNYNVNASIYFSIVMLWAVNGYQMRNAYSGTYNLLYYIIKLIISHDMF